mgnify:CR=1 FL=1
MADRRLFEEIADKIADMVRAGEFPPGSRLPGEREMSERLTEAAYARASAALGADDAQAAHDWMLVFDRLSRGVRLSIALEARAARERRRRQAGLD